MSHKKIVITLIVLIVAVGITLSGIYAVNGSDRVLLDFLWEIPLKAQKYTLTGESESWKVQCARYDGIILEGGRKRLLQDITLTYEYKGVEGTITEETPVTFSMEVDSIQFGPFRNLSGTTTLSPGDEYRTNWHTAAGYADDAPTDRLPSKDGVLSIIITFNGTTETVALLAEES